MSRVHALAKSGDCLTFGWFSLSHMSSVPRPSVLGNAANFAKGVLIGGIAVLFVWLALG